MGGIREIIGRIADGRMGDDEAAEFLRVVFEDGLQQDELVEMTLAMRDSGTKINWNQNISRRVVDKHSTGWGQSRSFRACHVALHPMVSEGLEHWRYMTSWSIPASTQKRLTRV